MSTIDPHKLWPKESRESCCDCGCPHCDPAPEYPTLLRVDIDGLPHYTNRFVALRVDRLYPTNSCHQIDGRGPATGGKNFDVQTTPDVPVTRWFQRRWVEPIQACGWRIVPTTGKHMHRILDEQGQGVGWIMPAVGGVPNEGDWVVPGGQS